MTDIYKWSTTASANATADSGVNYAEGMPPAALNDAGRSVMARVAAFLDDLGGVNTVGGTANAITVTLASAVTSYASGLMFCFKAASTNTAAPTLTVNSIGAKSIRKFAGSGEVALSAGDLQAGGIYFVVYDAAANSAAGAWILISPAIAGQVEATRLRLSATDDVTLSSTDHALQIGATSGQNLVIDGNEIQSRDNGAAATLLINAEGGNVSVGNASSLLDVSRLRLTATDDVTLASTTHALQIGATASANLAIDANEIQARNNGSAASLVLNDGGGAVETGANLQVGGDLTVLGDDITVGDSTNVGTVGNGFGEEISFFNSSNRVLIRTLGNTRLLLDSGTSVLSSALEVTGNIQSGGTYSSTTAQPANMYVATGGEYLRSTSAAKYKTDIAPIGEDMLSAFLSLSGVTYRSLCGGDDPDRQHIGIVADEAHAAGLTSLVLYGEGGEVEGFAYERTTALILEILKRLSLEVAQLRARLNAAGI